MDIVWILCFILTVIQTVYCSPCLLVNKRMSITRTIDPSIPFMTWKKGGNTITLAAYDSSSDNCTGPSNTAGYTIYCASGGVYTLEIHNPVNGDLYATVPTTTSLITFVQDPVNIDVSLTPQLTEDKILNKIEIFPVSCSVGCTTPSPYIQWMYQKQDGTQWDIRNMTTSPTSCSSGKWSITDNLDVSYSLINLDDVPFKVFCQVQYSDCDINGISSVSTDYFITFKDATSSSIPTSPTVITSTTSLSSQTPVTSQIPITSQSPITSLTPVTLQSPKTSKAPVTSQTPITSQSPTSDNDIIIIIIVFSCIAGIIVIVIVVCCCYFLIRHYRSKKRKEARGNTYDNNSAQIHGRINSPFKTTDSVRVQTSSKPESRRHISAKQQISTHHSKGQVSSKDDARKDAHHKRSKLDPELSSHAPYSPYYRQAPASRYYKTAPASGYYKTAPASGYYSQAPASGYFRHAPSSGYYIHAPSSGYNSQAPASGYHNTAPSSMYYSQPRSSASNPRYQSGGYRGDQPRPQQFDGFMFY